jgi:hypothetical protein
VKEENSFRVNQANASEFMYELASGMMIGIEP